MENTAFEEFDEFDLVSFFGDLRYEELVRNFQPPTPASTQDAQQTTRAAADRASGDTPAGPTSPGMTPPVSKRVCL